MKIKSLSNPYDADSSLSHNKNCQCETCITEKNALAPLSERQRAEMFEKQAEKMVVDETTSEEKPQFEDNDAMLDQAIENAIVRGVFGQNEMAR